MAFCGNCGVSISNGNFCTNCGAKIPKSNSDLSSDEQNSSKSILGHLLDLIDEHEADLYLGGLLNVESGELSVRSPRGSGSSGFEHPLSSCEECEGCSEGVPFFVECSSCLRSSNNYFWIRSGNGDGVYSVLEIFQDLDDDEDLSFIGFMAVLVPTTLFTQPVVNGVLERGDQIVDPAELEMFSDLEAFEISAVRVPAGGDLYVTDRFTEFDTENSSYFQSIIKETNFRCFGFAEFVSKDKNKSADGERAAVLEMMSQMYGKTIEASDVSIIPRIVVGLDEDWVKASKFKTGISRPEGEKVFYDWRISPTDAHAQPESGNAAYFNSQIAQVEYGLGNAVELSFLLLGAAHGDKDCLTRLKSPVFAEKLKDVESVADLFLFQDQIKIEEEIRKTGSLPSWLNSI